MNEPLEHAEGGSEGESARATFRRAQRLTHAREFQAVFDARMRTTVLGVGLSSGPNDLGRHRLGLSISRAVGAATVRTRLKRLIREWFRLRRHTLPWVPNGQPGETGTGGAGVDWVVSLRPNCPRTLEGMSAALDTLVARSIEEWTRRSRRRGTNAPPASAIKDTPRREDRAAKANAKPNGKTGGKPRAKPGAKPGTTRAERPGGSAE